MAPDERHWHASIGHAVSEDLVDWEPLPTALVPGPAGTWDELALWTGSVLRHRSGRWCMAYTGLRREDGVVVERIGLAWSDDLVVWRKDPANPVCEHDPRWYEEPGASAWQHGWRDPFLIDLDDGVGMLISARTNARRDPHRRGAVALATSSGGTAWTVHPPLSDSLGHAGELEVPHLVGDDLIVSTKVGRGWDPGDDRATWGGTARIRDGRLDPLVGDERCSLYAGRVVRQGAGAVLLAFGNEDASGRFVGGVSDPVALEIEAVPATQRSTVELVSRTTTDLMMRPDPGPSPRAR